MPSKIIEQKTIIVSSEVSLPIKKRKAYKHPKYLAYEKAEWHAAKLIYGWEVDDKGYCEYCMDGTRDNGEVINDHEIKYGSSALLDFDCGCARCCIIDDSGANEKLSSHFPHELEYIEDIKQFVAKKLNSNLHDAEFDFFMKLRKKEIASNKHGWKQY